MSPNPGFTLAELLVSLLIVGEIAAFSIPKIINAQQNTLYNAKAKEALSSVAAAYNAYKMSNTVSVNTRFGDLTSYLNYIKIDTTSTIDDKQTLGSLSCNVSAPGGCMVLHNGGVIRYTNDTLSGTNSTNAIEFYFDPNGTYGNTTNGPDKSIHLFLYYSGRVTSRGASDPNTVAAGVTYASANPSYDPSWFSW